MDDRNGRGHDAAWPTADPVLPALATAEDGYQSVRDEWARRAAELDRARRRAEDDLRQVRAELAAERERTARAVAAVADVHRAVFDGGVHAAALRAFLAATGAPRGVLAEASGGGLAVRAAVGFGGYPPADPSPFLAAVGRRVAAVGGPVAADRPAEFAALPAGHPDEVFANLLAAPVGRPAGGLVVLADKPGGFEDGDVAAAAAVGRQAAVAAANARRWDELVAAYFGVVGVLADAIQAKGPAARGRSTRVARLARATAAKLAASPDDVSLCCYAGLLHDVGNIGVSDGVLNKPGELRPEEWQLVQSHVRIGHQLLARVPALRRVADVVLHHHERFDGGGYPAGLKADAIPLAARIVGVADAYTAMTARRSFTPPLSPAAARAELERCKGSHFDPRVVGAFLAVLDEAAAGRPAAADRPPVTARLLSRPLG